MKAFRATGSFRAGKRDQPYSVDVVAANKDDAVEQVLSNFGSRHRVSRRFVVIDDMSEIDPSESTALGWSLTSETQDSGELYKRPRKSECPFRRFLRT